MPSSDAISLSKAISRQVFIRIAAGQLPANSNAGYPLTQKSSFSLNVGAML